MTVRRLGSQEAQHDSGAILRSHGRDALQFELEGRVLTIPVELGRRGDIVYLPPEPRWDDGTPVAPEVAARLRPIIEEIEAFWGMQASFPQTG